MTTITVFLPKKALEALRKRAEEEGRPLEEVASEAVLAQLNADDPATRAELHWELCEKYLREAKEFLAKGDFVQASEKAWGAAAQAVKAVAAREGRVLRSHRELHLFVASLVGRLGDEELRRLWSAAGELHRNFYEAWLPPALVKGYVKDVDTFTAKLREVERLNS